MLKRTLFEPEHELFRESFRGFVEREIVPHADAWEQAGIVDKAMFRRAGEHGFLGMEIPEVLGGGGVD
ncbi:MAG: acyl-CoA dehydrogenase family protein, partial [Acidimicrobiia bacterium]|nr:acyl-CoA dehydrogenase family protein [Acidimicrobiia bacterium]